MKALAVIPLTVWWLASCTTPGTIASSTQSAAHPASASPSSSATASCVPRVAASPPPKPTPPLPKPVRVNTALGANVRAAPSVTADRIGFLRQFTLGNADEESTDTSGARWYRVTASGVTGWIHGDLLIDEPAVYFPRGTWSAVVPKGNSTSWISENAVVHVQDPDRIYWWLLQVAVTPTAASLPSATEWPIIDLYPNLYERSEPVSVWTYAVRKRVVRASFDICNNLTDETKRNGVWTYVTVVEVVTDVRAYQFVFVTPEPDPSVVRQVLDSVTITPNFR